MVLTQLSRRPSPGRPHGSREVAERLVELSLGEPAGRVPDLAGPRIHGMRELVRGYLEATGKHRLTMPVRLPGKAGRAYRDGANLGGPDAQRGERAWEDFLAERLDAAGRHVEASGKARGAAASTCG